MKKFFVLLVSVILLAGLMISCNPDQAVDKRAVVKLNAAEEFKGLSSSVEYADKADLTWYYQATTDSTAFNYGATNGWEPCTIGAEIELSQGIWDFELKAVEKNADADAPAIYYGTKRAYILAQNGPVPVTVPVFVQDGKGYLSFGDITIDLRSESSDTVKANMVKVNGSDIALPSDAITLDSGAYEVKVWYEDPADSIVKAEETITVTIYGGATTKISGNLSEITQDVVIGTFTEVPVAVSEVLENITADGNKATVSEKATVNNGSSLSVTLPAGTVIEAGAGDVVGTVKTGISAVNNDTANIEIAGIESANVFKLTLNVSQDNTTLIDVAYAIGAGLDISKVFHNDDELPSASAGGEWYEYDSASGILTLHIYHASYITILEGKGYASNYAELVAALDEGVEEIVLTGDIAATGSIVINNPVTIEGNGRTITSSAMRTIDISNVDGVTFKNFKLVTTGERGFNIGANATNITIDNVDAKAANYVVNVILAAANTKVDVSNSTLTGLNVVNIWAPGSDITIENCDLYCKDNADEGYAVLMLYPNAENGSIIATGCNFYIDGDSFPALNQSVSGRITIAGSNEEISEAVAAVGYGNEYYYACLSLEDAIATANEGDEILLLRDITAASTIVIDKPVVFNGNNKTLTSTMDGTSGRAININTEGNVVIKNLTIKAAGERAINVIQKPVNLVIDNVTATADNYTLNVAGSAPGANVAVSNSTLNGLCTVNVASKNAVVTIDNCTINCNDNNTTEGESYAGIGLNKDAVNGKIIATNTTINVVEGSDSVAARNGAEGGVITVDGSDEGVVVLVACIEYSGSPYYHAFESVKEAIEFAKTGDTVKLIRDIELTEAIILDEAKAITLDLNGKTIKNANGVYDPGVASALVCVKGSTQLTITGEGTIDGSEYDDYAVEVRGGKLVIEDGTYIGSATAAYAFSGEIEIKGGSFAQVGYENDDYVVNLKDENGNAGTASIEITGGSFTGFNPADNKSECPAKNYVPEGYTSVENANVWTVSASN